MRFAWPRWGRGRERRQTLLLLEPKHIRKLSGSVGEIKWFAGNLPNLIWLAVLVKRNAPLNTPRLAAKYQLKGFV